MAFDKTGAKIVNLPCDATSYNFRNGREKKVNTPDLNVKPAVIKIKK